MSQKFELLQQRKLSAFEQRLASERQVGVDDAWTTVGEAWLRLINCEPIEPGMMSTDAHPRNTRPGPQGSVALARVVFESLRLEHMRRERLLYHRGTGFRKRSISGTLSARLDDEDFFARAPGEIADDLVKWPPNQEAWADELPAAIGIKSACTNHYKAMFTSARAERVALDARVKRAKLAFEDPAPRTRLSLKPTDDPKRLKPQTLAWYQHRELEQVVTLRALAAELPAVEAKGQGVDAMVWRATYHRATLYGELAYALAQLPKPNYAETQWAQQWAQRSRDAIEPLAARELAGDPAPMDAKDRAFALLVWAEGQLATKQYTPALKGFEAADALGVDGPNVYLGRHLHLRTLFELQDWDAVVGFAARLPPASSRYFAPMVYRVSYGMRKRGDVDTFLATAMTAFRDKAYRADPFMRALYISTLRVLTEYPFEARIIELLEDMGPRSLTYERVEEYATIALDQGRAENARAAARWLLAKHSNAQFHPRYHALLSLAAFLQNKPEAFITHLDDITLRSPQLLQAIPARRRATFFASADAQLARVFRQMLPVMAEWGEGAPAQALRQKWLGVIINRAQQFVRDVPKSLARPSLVELYRIASAMLDDDRARAYPERVGTQEPAPLVLGTVRVESRNLSPFEPDGVLRARIMRSLTLLPEDTQPLDHWRASWSALSWPAQLKANQEATQQAAPAAPDSPQVTPKEDP